MSLRPEALRGAGRSDTTAPVHYRLARNAVLNEFRRGRMSRIDLCDAHPELVRAAREVGRPTEELCPICEAVNLVLVSYVFGSRLPAHGRCITTTAELRRFATKRTEFTCYVVEVCPDCSWNHLVRMFTLGGRTPARS